MGIDLTLLPVDFDSRRIPERDDLPPSKPWAHSFTRLRVPRAQGSWDEIEALATPIDVPFSSTEMDYRAAIDGGEPRAEDCYGKPLTWAPAGEVVEVLSRAQIDQGVQADERMDAIVAYLRALPPGNLVVLYWQ